MERPSASKIAQWHPTPALLPGKPRGRRSLVGCSPWGLRVGHDWEASLSLLTFMHWRRKWQPTPGFLPGESQGQRSLVGCRLWGCTVRHSWCNAAAAEAVAHSKQYELGLSNTMAAVKISTDNKIWWRCINKGNLVHCWWKCKLMQPQWKTVWRFLKN